MIAQALAEPYIAALSDIARALRWAGFPAKEPSGPVVWSVDQLPGQVERALTDLRIENQKLRQKVERLEARERAGREGR